MIRPHYVPLYSGVSMSEKLAALPDDSCRLFYTWLLSHCDAWGRSKAGAGHLTAKVWPLLGKTREDTERALEECWAAGLIVRYDVDGEAYLAVPDWEEKAGKVGDTKRRGKSLFPAPPDGLSKSSPGIPGVVLPRARAHDPSLIRSDPILSEPERREDPTGGAASPTAPLPRKRRSDLPTKPDGPHKEFIAWWVDAFEAATGSAYAFEGAKDGAHVKAILGYAKGELGLARERAVLLLRGEDPYYAEKGINLATLRSQWNRLGSSGRPILTHAQRALRKAVRDSAEGKTDQLIDRFFDTTLPPEMRLGGG